MNVLSRNFELGEIGQSIGNAANFFNKYSVHAVLNELIWALERDRFPEDDILYPLTEGIKYADLQLGSAKLKFPKEEILRFRHRFLDAVMQVAKADVVILTLGYVETWYDTQLGIYLNIAPPVRLCKAQPGRFEFRVLKYDDILQGLNDIYKVLKKHRTKPLKMLLTVSPVPLLSTFRNIDVLVANAYSKAVQRAAIDEFITDKQDVDYFPSYEFVTLSNPTIAWSRGDYRHVSPDIVARIMSDVIHKYIPELSADTVESPAENPPMTPQAVIASARLLFQLGSDEELLALLGANASAARDNVDILLLKAKSLKRCGNLVAAFDALSTAVNLAPKRPIPLERLVEICRPLRRRDQAQELVQAHVDRFPARNEFRDGLRWLSG